MAHILYGVAGEGSGHSSRAKLVISHLEKEGHSVTVVTHGRGYRNLSPHFPVHQITGLHFDYSEDNTLHYIGTAIKNALKAPELADSVNRVAKLIKAEKPCLVFSDFEPVTSVAANLRGVPIVSIDNQHRLTNTQLDYPSRYLQEAAAAAAVTAMMVQNPVAYLITSFHPAKPTSRKSFVFPPILREEVRGLTPGHSDFVLVYLTSPFKALIPMLRQIRQRFVVYGYDRTGRLGNLTFKKPSQKGFLRDLAHCQGVLANAGFTLITEALHLGKPYLALPIQGQFEQVLNAVYLEKLGYGKYWDRIDKEKIESFLFNLELYTERVQRYERTDNSRLLAKVDSLVARYARRTRPKR
jgi:uncharacterized protein (TIGR00661 family)